MTLTGLLSRLLTLSLLALPVAANAQRTLTENIPASNQSLFVSTRNPTLMSGTTQYNGSISSPTLRVLINGNVSIGTGTSAANSDRIVMYATGSVVAGMFVGNYGGTQFNTIAVATAALNASTASLRSDFSNYVSTNGPLVAALGVSTASLNSLKYDKTGGGISGSVTVFSTITAYGSGLTYGVTATTATIPTFLGPATFTSSITAHTGLTVGNVASAFAIRIRGGNSFLMRTTAADVLELYNEDASAVGPSIGSPSGGFNKLCLGCAANDFSAYGAMLDVRGDARFGTTGKSTFTATGALSSPYIQVSSITTTGGTGIAIKAASGPASSGQGYLDLTYAGFGGATQAYIGNVSAGAIGYNSPSSTFHRFYINHVQMLNIQASGIQFGDSSNSMPLTLLGASGYITSPSSGNFSGLFGVALAISGSTFTVNDNGITNTPSQPRAIMRVNASQVMPAGTEKLIYWGTDDKVTQGMHSTTLSSSTVTVPVGGAGSYNLAVKLFYTGTITGGYRQVRIKKNGANLWLCNEIQDVQGYNFNGDCTINGVELADGDAITATLQSSVSVDIFSASDNTSRFEVIKR